MTGRFANYDSEAVDLIVAAIPINDGRAENPFVTVDADGEAFGVEQGADGHVVRYATHNRLYTVQVFLKASSEHNQQLAALHALDVNATNGAGVGAFLLKDNNGATLMAGAQCWVHKAPPRSFGREVGDVEWLVKVVANPATMIVGGN